MNQQILDEIARRRISRLCHFTHVDSLVDIFRHGHIYSRRKAEQKNILLRRNDTLRLDKHFRYVSASVQYPNLYVLESFRKRVDDNLANWVIIFFDPKLMGSYSTLFSPVNAAAGTGKYIKGGLEGFASMFEEQISFGSPSHGVKPRVRSSSHLSSCPTCLQAEVLIRDSVAVDAFHTIVTYSALAQETVRARLADVNTRIPAIKFERRLYSPSSVVRLIGDGNRDLDG